MERSSPPSPRRRAITIGVIVAVAVGIGFLVKKGNFSVTILNRPPAPPPVIITTGTVKDGDVFAVMLSRRGLQGKYIPPVEKAFAKQFKIPSIQAGHMYEIVTSTTGEFQQFIYRTDPVHSFIVKRSSENVYESSTEVSQTVWIERRVTAEVTKFVEADLRASGYDQTLIDNLTYELGENIFGWRIDFFTEQRKGDKLDVLLEEEYLIGEDKPIKGGKHMRVIVASYTGSGTKNKENFAIRYQPNPNKRAEFYDPDGKAMRRVFLRAPFTKGAFRVSSNFNNHRFHPILRVYRPHHGTDYAASVGTPVAAIGNGQVVRAEWFKGYGNCVDIRHTPRYTSRYGHLSKIAVRRGQSIAQGQYIGKVGNTGLSTGPHLHFEMLVDGTQRNFLAMSFPASSSLDKSDMPNFIRVRDAAMSRLGKASQQPQKLASVRR